MTRYLFIVLLISAIGNCDGVTGACVIERDLDAVCIEDVDRDDCKECTSADDCACSDFSSECGDGLADFESFHKNKSCKSVDFPNQCKDGLFWEERYDCDTGLYGSI